MFQSLFKTISNTEGITNPIAFHIRELAGKDTDRILEIRKSAIAKELEIYGSREETLSKQLRLYGLIKLAKRLTGTAFYTIYVGEVKGQVVGTATLTERNDCWNISAVMVDPKYRRRGYGKALVSKACNHASFYGARRIVLHVSEDNSPAKNLYRSLNFSEFERLTYFCLKPRKISERTASGFELIRTRFPSFHMKLISRLLNTRTTQKYAVKVDDRWVGYYTFLFPSKGQASRATIYLCKKYRGLGIEDSLLQHALDKAYEKRSPRLIISLDEENIELKRACKKIGFEKFFVMEGMARHT